MSRISTAESEGVRGVIRVAKKSKKPKGLEDGLRLVSGLGGVPIGPTTGRLTISMAENIIAPHVFSELPMGVVSRETDETRADVYLVSRPMKTREILGSDEDRIRRSLTEHQIVKFVAENPKYLATNPDSSTFFLCRSPVGRITLVSFVRHVEREGVACAGITGVGPSYTWYPQGRNLFVFRRPAHENN